MNAFSDVVRKQKRRDNELVCSPTELSLKFRQRIMGFAMRSNFFLDKMCKKLIARCEIFLWYNLILLMARKSFPRSASY